MHAETAETTRIKATKEHIPLDQETIKRDYLAGIFNRLRGLIVKCEPTEINLEELLSLTRAAHRDYTGLCELMTFAEEKI